MSAASLQRTVLTLAAAAYFAAGCWATPASAAVFGNDDRRDLPPANQSLANKIGLLTDLKSRSQCTAVCLSENIIATAAHCLYRTQGERRPDLANFRFKLHGRPDQSASRIAGTRPGAAMAHVMTGSMSLRVKPPIEATRDWALVHLETPVCQFGGLPLSEHPVAELNASQTTQPVYQVGYHRDFPGERLAFGTPCTISSSFRNANRTTIASDFENAEDLILHTCDTGGASSGSPLLIDGPDGPEIAGLNVGTYVLSRVVSANGVVTHRYQAENVANTGVSARAFADAWETFTAAGVLAARNGMRELQGLLAGVGVYTGPRNGIYGFQTRTAIETFERIEGRTVTGLATTELMKALRTSLVARSAAPHTPPSAHLETGSVQGLGLTSSSKKN